MRYIALLRGINVGGNNMVKMASLKDAVESCGYTHVTTYIQSGNILFDTEKKDTSKISDTLEIRIIKTFGMTSRVVVFAQTQFAKILSDVPSDWKKRNDIRCYIAFLIPPTTTTEVIGEVSLKYGIDFVNAGPGVVYMTTLMSGLTKSGFTKLVGTKVYQHITMRNYNTSKKLLDIMIQK